MPSPVPRTRRIGRGVFEVVDPYKALTSSEKKIVNRIIEANDVTAAKKLLKYLRRYGCRFNHRCCSDC